MLGIGTGLIYQGSLHEQLYSLNFDGNDYMDTGATFQDVFRDSFTIGFWCRLNDGVHPSVHQFLFGTSEGDPTVDAVSGSCRVTSGDYMFYTEANNDWGTYTTDAAIFGDGDTGWIHIVNTVTFSGSGSVDVAIYINGAAVAITSTSPTTEANMSDYTNPHNLHIGSYNGDGTPASQGVGGNIDEFAIWDVALDADAVEVVYNSGKPFNLTSDRTTGAKVYDNASDLVGYWRMNDGSGTTVTDSSGNGNPGTLAGNTTFSTDTPDD